MPLQKSGYGDLRVSNVLVQCSIGNHDTEALM